MLAPSSVQEPEASDTASGEETATEVHTRDRPESFSLWHREIVTFRASYKDATPERRVENAFARLELVKPAGDWEVSAVAAQVGELSGYYVTVEGTSIFGLVKEDLDPVSSPPLEAIANRAAEDLRAVLVARWCSQSCFGCRAGS